MFAALFKRRLEREAGARRKQRELRFESLENRLLMTRSGLVGFDFTAPYDVTTSQGVRVVGDADFDAEFTFLNSSDLSQISLGINSVTGTGVVSGSFNGAPTSGTVDVQVENVDFNLAPNNSGVVSMDATATGSFHAVISTQGGDIQSPGDFVATFLGTVNLTNGVVVGNLDLSIETDDNQIDEDFVVPIAASASIAPNAFTLPNQTEGSVSGMLWLDADLDGQRDEAGTSDDRRQQATVQLVDSQATVVSTAVTNLFGGYSFLDIPAGDYTLRVSDLPKGNKLTVQDTGDEATDSDIDPSSFETPTITVTVGQNIVNIDGGVIPGSAYQNLRHRHDVDGNARFGIADALGLINFVRVNTSAIFGPVPETRQDGELFRDVDGSGSFVLLDLFDTINALRDSLTEKDHGEGEGGFDFAAWDDDRTWF